MAFRSAHQTQAGIGKTINIINSKTFFMCNQVLHSEIKTMAIVMVLLAILTSEAKANNIPVF